MTSAQTSSAISGLLTTIIVGLWGMMCCQSCNTSGCTDNQNSLPLAGFYSSATGEAVSLSDIDISGVGQKADSLLYTSGTPLQSVYLPFRSLYNSVSYALHYTQEGIDDPQWNDTITFQYTSRPYFASEECGAMLTYTIFHTDGEIITLLHLPACEVVEIFLPVVACGICGKHIIELRVADLAQMVGHQCT